VSPAELEGLLERWRREGRLAPLDRRLGLFVARGSGRPALGLLAALASRQLRDGHVCLERGSPPEDLWEEGRGELAGVWEAAWREAEGAAGGPWLGASAPTEERAGEGLGPLLVREDGRLYLARLHHAEREVARRLRALAAGPLAPAPDPALLERLFGGRPEAEEQRLAAAAAAVLPLAVITGGPGTGKTTTVLKVLALRLHRRPALAVRLLAPTGKAAARLAESLRRGRKALPPALAARIPAEVSTVHRFLGLGLPGRPPRHHAHRPAPVDLVVLDEASMVDLPTMHRLLEALPEGCALILLGDPHQLASVEAGSVLADLVGAARPGRRSPRLAAALGEAGIAWEASSGASPEATPPEATPLDDALWPLRRSHRFAPDRGIGRLAEAVRRGEAPWELVEALAREGGEVECLTWTRHGTGHLGGAGEPPRAAWEDLLEALDPARAPGLEEALAGLDRARCLCALREGPAGVEGLNTLLARALGRPRPQAHGQPVLVTRNAHALGVHNGDMGVLWAEGGRLRACFPREDGILRLPLGELPAHEPAYALTVHKSQGSEYDRVLLVLPPEPHPLVSRELLYTALTRARRQVRILASPRSWEAGVARPTRRAGGLRQRLAKADLDGAAQP